MKRSGFTLIELIVVIALLSVLVTLGAKGLRNIRIQAKKAQAMTEMQAIETAVKSYLNAYGKLPVPADLQGGVDPGANADFSLAVINILTGENTEDNPRNAVFLDPQDASSSATNRAFMDPWGIPYSIVMDTDYDGSFTYEGDRIQRTSGVISLGLFMRTRSPSDQIKSWE